MKLGVLLFVAILVVLTGEGKNISSSRDAMEEWLRERNIQLGYDEERGRIVAVKTRSVSMNVGKSSGELPFEGYDFLDDANDDFETRRFKTVWKAYADGLAEIATLLKASIKNTETKKDGIVVSTTMEKEASWPLNGVVTIEMCESLTADGEYEVTVAVCQSIKRQKAYLSGLNGGESSPGKCTLSEWVDQKSKMGIICPQTYCDNEGVWWRVAGVPVELDEGRNSKKVAMLTEKAKRYAYEAAMRTLAVRVSARTSMSVNLDVGKGGDRLKNKMEKTVKIKPMNMVLPIDPSQVQWFEFDRRNVFTGKSVRCVVAALRSGTRKREEKITPVLPEKREAPESAPLGISASSKKQMNAREQAFEFCMKNGLLQGFDEERKIITLIVNDTFEYEKKMSDEEFARKRYLTVQRTLMRGGSEISQILVRMREDRSRVYGRDYSFMIGRFVDDEEDEDWISQLMSKMLGREFSWRARLMRTEGTAMINCPLLGLSIVRQFESLSEDRYQVALIISLDVEKGKNEIASFYDGKPEPPGKMSLRQWMDTQDFGVVVGPRRFVDNEGTIWALGVVPSAEGQQPYGTLLDAAARECAAFAFGGKLSVSINEGDPVHSITGSGDKAGDSGNSKNGSFIELKAIGTGVYPRELEQYFRRPYTHPLTGRKGVVAICALRSGASEIMKEIMVRKMKKMQEKQYEAGMRAGMLEQLKTLVNELDKMNTGDGKTNMLIRKLRREIFRFEGELQQEQSLRKKNRERTCEKLAELRRKVLELKGGKDNEE